jgi:nuclear pore complex protein Nup133
VLVQPQITGGRHSVVCRTLKAPQGWLGGIGRRVSSLIFGGLPTSQVIETVSTPEDFSKKFVIISCLV